MLEENLGGGIVSILVTLFLSAEPIYWLYAVSAFIYSISASQSDGGNIIKYCLLMICEKRVALSSDNFIPSIVFLFFSPLLVIVLVIGFSLIHFFLLALIGLAMNSIGLVDSLKGLKLVAFTTGILVVVGHLGKAMSVLSAELEKGAEQKDPDPA